MQAESSSPLPSNPSRKQRNDPDPTLSLTLSLSPPSPPKTAPHRRRGADKIADPQKRSATFWKRSNGLLKKASALNSLTGARVAVIVFSPKDKLCSFGIPSVEEVFFEYLRWNKGDVELPMSPKEGMDWAEKECDSCATKEDCASLIMKYQVVLNCLRKKLKDFDINPSVKDGAGDDSGVGAGRDPNVLKDDKINSILKDFEASYPSLLGFHEGRC